MVVRLSHGRNVLYICGPGDRKEELQLYLDGAINNESWYHGELVQRGETLDALYSSQEDETISSASPETMLDDHDGCSKGGRCGTIATRDSFRCSG